MWVLETGLESSGRALCALNHGALSLALLSHFKNGPFLGVDSMENFYSP